MVLTGWAMMKSPVCAPATATVDPLHSPAGMFGGSNVAVVETAAMSTLLRPPAPAASTTFALPTALAPIVGAGYVPASPPPADPLGAALPAVVAVVAFVADGTVPKVASLMSAPVSELPATFGDVIAFAFTFNPVTAFFLSCFVPTLFFGSAIAA